MTIRLSQYQSRVLLFCVAAITAASATPLAYAGAPGAFGDLYVTGESSNSVVQFDGANGATVGAFVASGSGGLSDPWDCLFGPNGSLFVCSNGTSSVMEYNGATGAFIRVFVASGNGGLSGARAIAFDASGDLYIASSPASVLKFSGSTGAFIQIFVTNGSGGLSDVRQLTFGPNGNLFVVSNNTGNVFQYSGATGALINAFTSGGASLVGVAFHPAGNLFTSSAGNNNVVQWNGATGAMIGVFASGGGVSSPRHITFGGPSNNLFVTGNGSNNVVEYNGISGAVVRQLSGGGLSAPYGLTFKAAHDCNANGSGDAADIAGGTSRDCDGNGMPDECQIAQGGSAPGGPFFCTSGCDPDCNTDGRPDACEPDCNRNTIPDVCDFAAGTSRDCNGNTLPDDCDIAGPTSDDCNGNQVPDECDLAQGTSGDCDGNMTPDECAGPVGTVRWVGSNGGLFTESSNWNPPIVPAGGSDAVLSNTTATDNTCILNQAGALTVCSLTLGSTGTGRQILQIHDDAILQTNGGIAISTGGDLDLQGGEVGGGTVTNDSNSIRGSGHISASILNRGLLLGSPFDLLRLSGGSLTNESAGIIQAMMGSGLIITSPAVYQSGDIEIRTLAGAQFQQPLTNSTGGLITLLGGSIGSAAITNQPGADITGTGTIDSSLFNAGEMTLIANMLLVGNLNNTGTITIQSGILTITGSLSGSGTIIGSFGGREGGDAGLLVRGDVDIASTHPRQIDLTTATVQMDGGAANGSQTLEVLAADVGSRITLPNPDLFSIGTLRIGPTATTVRLVDRHGNSPGADRRLAGDRHEALYVSRLILDPGVTLDLAGLHLYYGRVTPANPLAPDSEVHVIDSVGGGELIRLSPGTHRISQAPAPWQMP